MKLDSDVLRKLQLEELELLKEVDRVCRKNNIKYTLCEGTLLGAVRHKGFIPWDDDADVAFLPDDFDRFFEACKEDLNTEKFFLQDYRTDPYYRWGYAKLRRNNSLYARVGQEHMKYHNGICIDIFVLYNVPDNHFLNRLYHAWFFIIRKFQYSEAGRVCDKNILKRLLFKAMSIVPIKTIFRCANATLIKKPTDTVSVLYYPNYKRNKYGVKRGYFDETTDYTFENYTFKGVIRYDEYLTATYGDYMTPPPEEDRGSHCPASKILFPND